VVLAATVVLALTVPLGPAASAAGPYEPNDALPSAAGPLAIGQTYTAAIETATDRDFFYFYVTSSAPAQTTIALRNLAGGGGISGVNATILSLLGTPLGAIPYVERGEERSAALSLSPQKYIVEVASSEGATDPYSLSTGGGPGAFGPYSRIAQRCSAATNAATAARTRLSRAETKLQRATSRLRRARYAGAAARTAARSLHRQAQAKVRNARRALRAAKASKEPWCSIPP
jgi:hypothetical protein